MDLKDQGQAALMLLSSLIRVRGWSRNALDRELGFRTGYLSRLLLGNTKLLYEHILLILEAIDIEPSFFFNCLHGPGAPERLEEVPPRIEQIVKTLILQGQVGSRRPSSRNRGLAS